MFLWSGGLALAFLPRTDVRAQGVAVSGLVDLSYQHGFDGDAPENLLTLGFRMRSLTGQHLASCIGLDARAGVGGGGAAYAVEAFPAGFGFRYGGTSAIAICIGLGGSAVSDGAVPFAWTLPVELFWEATGVYRIVRPLLVARIVQVAGSGDRNAGSRLVSLGDEIHAAAGVRIMVPAEPLTGFWTGDGIFIGLTYDEALDARIVGVAIGYGFVVSH